MICPRCNFRFNEAGYVKNYLITCPLCKCSFELSKIHNNKKESERK